MRLLENILHVFGGIQPLIKGLRIALIGKGNLVLQINKTVVDRRCREHQNFGFNSGTNHLIHQTLVSVILRLAVRTNAVAEVVRFINHHKIIVAPVQAIQVKTVGLSAIAGKVRMEQNIVVQPVRCNRVIDIVVLVCIPVFSQLLRAKHQHRLVSIFVILYNCQRSECFTKTDAISKDAAVVLFQFVDDGKHGIPLEIVQHTPDFALLETSSLVRQFIFRDIIQKFTEHMIQGHKIDELRRIFCIGCADVFQNHVRDILHLFTIIPQSIKKLHILLGERSFHAVDYVVAVIATLTADVHRRKPIDWHIGRLCCFRIHSHKASHVFTGGIRFEFCFFLDPVSTLFCDSSLGHLIAQLDFKLCTV